MIASNSKLSRVKRYLLGIPEPITRPEYFVFGGEVHSRFLENKKLTTLILPEEKILSSMVKAMQDDKTLGQYLLNSLREHTVKDKLFTVDTQGIIDIWNQNQSAVVDIKTTSCKSYKEFLESCIKYDYFRQGYIYKKLTSSRVTIFSGVMKNSPYKIFHVRIEDYPKEMGIAMNETKFLLHYYKNHYEDISSNRANSKSKDAEL